MIEDNLLGPKMRILYGSVLITLGILYGSVLIALGIITAVVTYRYVFPMGSIISILSGLIFIFWNRFKSMVRNIS